MAKKTLKEKIKDIVFYAIIFFILYLILGFLIKSEWLTSFTQSWVYTYEVLRDALTLTAYFLAPAAAFVLFSDWREQHREINNEKISLDVNSLLKKLHKFMNMPPSLEEYEKGEVKNEFFIILLDARSALRELNPFDEKSNEFKSLAIKLLELAHEFWDINAQELYWYKTTNELKSCVGYDPRDSYIAFHRKKQYEMTEKRIQIFTEFTTLLGGLKILYVE